MERFEFAPDGVARAADAAVNVLRFRVRVGGDIEQDFAPQWRDGIAGAATVAPMAIAPRTTCPSCLAKRVGISNAWASMTSPR